MIPLVTTSAGHIGAWCRWLKWMDGSHSLLQYKSTRKSQRLLWQPGGCYGPCLTRRCDIVVSRCIELRTPTTLDRVFTCITFSAPHSFGSYFTARSCFSTVLPISESKLMINSVISGLCKLI